MTDKKQANRSDSRGVFERVRSQVLLFGLALLALDLGSCKPREEMTIHKASTRQTSSKTSDSQDSLEICSLLLEARAQASSEMEARVELALADREGDPYSDSGDRTRGLGVSVEQASQETDSESELSRVYWFDDQLRSDLRVDYRLEGDRLYFDQSADFDLVEATLCTRKSCERYVQIGRTPLRLGFASDEEHRLRLRFFFGLDEGYAYTPWTEAQSIMPETLTEAGDYRSLVLDHSLLAEALSLARQIEVEHGIRHLNAIAYLVAMEEVFVHRRGFGLLESSVAECGYERPSAIEVKAALSQVIEDGGDEGEAEPSPLGQAESGEEEIVAEASPPEPVPAESQELGGDVETAPTSPEGRDEEPESGARKLIADIGFYAGIGSTVVGVVILGRNIYKLRQNSKQMRELKEVVAEIKTAMQDFNEGLKKVSKTKRKKNKVSVKRYKNLFAKLEGTRKAYPESFKAVAGGMFDEFEKEMKLITQLETKLTDLQAERRELGSSNLEKSQFLQEDIKGNSSLKADSMTNLNRRIKSWYDLEGPKARVSKLKSKRDQMNKSTIKKLAGFAVLGSALVTAGSVLGLVEASSSNQVQQTSLRTKEARLITLLNQMR